MVEATLETLLVSGAVSCWFGWRRRHKVSRTIELHNDGVLYCFDEPRNSMAKNLQERLSLIGSRIIDCGTHRSSLCFGIELADISCVEQLHPTGLFTSFAGSSSNNLDKCSKTNIRTQIALFFTGDKLLKWRFICYIRRASLSSLAGESIDGISDSINYSGDSSGIYRRLCRPARIIDETGDDPLEGHEIMQLEDVLRIYEEQQKQQKERQVNVNEEEKNIKNETQIQEQKHFIGNNNNNNKSNTDESKAPERLKESPLFFPCILGNPSNQSCADCGAPWPTWVLLKPFGGFVCIHCVGIHRQLWPHKCREAQLDTWNSNDIEFIKNRGNDVLNSELEYDGFYTNTGEQVYKPVSSYSLHDVRERYIQLKYNGEFSRDRHTNGDSNTNSINNTSNKNNNLTNNTTSSSKPNLPKRKSSSLIWLPPRDPDVFLGSDLIPNSNGTPDEEGPPRYIGVAYITIKEIEGIRSLGAVLALTNGFQEVRSRAGDAIEGNSNHYSSSNNNCSCCNGSTKWEERLQLGVHSLSDPLYAALYSSNDELLGVAEWTLPDNISLFNSEQEQQQQQLITVPILWYSVFSSHRWLTQKLFGAAHQCHSNGEWRQPLLYLTMSFTRFG